MNLRTWSRLCSTSTTGPGRCPPMRWSVEPAAMENCRTPRYCGWCTVRPCSPGCNWPPSSKSARYRPRSTHSGHGPGCVHGDIVSSIADHASPIGQVILRSQTYELSSGSNLGRTRRRRLVRDAWRLASRCRAGSGHPGDGEAQRPPGRPGAPGQLPRSEHSLGGEVPQVREPQPDPPHGPREGRMPTLRTPPATCGVAIVLLTDPPADPDWHSGRFSWQSDGNHRSGQARATAGGSAR